MLFQSIACRQTCGNEFSSSLASCFSSMQSYISGNTEYGDTIPQRIDFRHISHLVLNILYERCISRLCTRMWPNAKKFLPQKKTRQLIKIVNAHTFLSFSCIFHRLGDISNFVCRRGARSFKHCLSQTTGKYGGWKLVLAHSSLKTSGQCVTVVDGLEL